RGAERRAVVVVAAPVPFTVPGAFEPPRQPPRVVLVTRGAGDVVARAAERHEVNEDAVEEESEPRALATALRADAVHPVVPVAAADERQTVRARRQPFVDRAHA